MGEVRVVSWSNRIETQPECYKGTHILQKRQGECIVPIDATPQNKSLLNILMTLHPLS